MSLNQKITRKNGIKSFECEYCGKKFKTKYRVDRHRRTVHKNVVESYKCQNCGNLYFNTEEELEEHNQILHHVQIETELPNTTFSILQCEICQTAFFLSNQDLEDHKQTIHSNPDLNQQNELQTLLQMTPSSRIDVNDFGEEELNVLDQTLINSGVNDVSQSDSEKEIQTLHEMTPSSKNYIIDFNEEDLNVLENVLDQALMNSGVNDVSHQNEPKDSDSEKGIQTLLQMTPSSSNDVVNFDEDNLNMFDQALMNTGANDDSNEPKDSDSKKENAVEKSTLGKRFQCEECSSSYSRKHELNLHVSKKHLGENYKCHICGLMFCKRSKLTFHYFAVHKIETKVHCTECQKVFVSDKLLKRHMIANHERSLTCNQCNKTFTHFKSLESHTATIHEKVRHNCESCGKSYSRDYLLRTHICLNDGSDDKTSN